MTCAFPSGPRYGMSPLVRASVRRLVIRCASMIGSGMSSGVSSHANPNIIPWSPAPPESTPIAMSPVCRPMWIWTSTESASKLSFLPVYPIRRIVPRTTASSTSGAGALRAVASPAITARPAVTSVSQATRARGSRVRKVSRMASEIWSATLSGWPSVTDSEVKSRMSRGFRTLTGRLPRSGVLTGGGRRPSPFVSIAADEGAR